MATVFSFAKIASFFIGEEGALERGENGFRSKHVKSCVYDAKLKFLKGDVHASMRKEVIYHIEIYLKDNMEVEKASCNCKRGLLKCHHMATLLFWAYHNISSTDTLCKWVAPRVAPEDDSRDISQLFPPGPSHTNVDSPTGDQLSSFIEDLRIAGVGAGLLWKVRTPPLDDIPLLPDVEEVVMSKEFEEALDKPCLIREALKVNSAVRGTAEEKTRGQSRNPLWLSLRKNRLTASNFGLILNYLNKPKLPKSFWSRIFGLYKLDGIKAIQWGRDHEDDAVQRFSEVSGLKVERNGLFVHENGFLAASPDGLVEDGALLEVKCPFSLRSVSSLKEAQKNTDKRNFFHYKEDGDIVINADHEYYHQIQGQMYITGRTKCHFFQWCLNDFVWFPVEKDSSWERNVDLLESFFLNKFIPKLISRLESDKQSDASTASSG